MRAILVAMTTPRGRWQAAFDAAQQRDADFDTMSGVPVAPVYGPADGEFPGHMATKRVCDRIRTGFLFGEHPEPAQFAFGPLFRP